MDQFGTEGLRAIVLVDGPLNSEATADRAVSFYDHARAMLLDRKKYVREQVRGMFKRPHEEERYREIGEANLKTLTTTAIVLQADGLRYDSRPLLKKIDKPVLFVNASVPSNESQARTIRSELPAARIEFMEGVGHALFLDDTDRFKLHSWKLRTVCCPYALTRPAPGSHGHFKHPDQRYVITVPGNEGKDLALGTLNAILKKAGLK